LSLAGLRPASIFRLIVFVMLAPSIKRSSHFPTYSTVPKPGSISAVTINMEQHLDCRKCILCTRQFIP
jgi:hypothetical protein